MSTKGVKTTNIDILNIGLIVVSFILAITLPIRLFLFSYIILGPLHYLTEIGWLNKRNYFAKRRADVSILVLLTILLTLSFYFSHIDISTENSSSFVKTFITINETLGAKLVFFAFGTALGIVLFSNNLKRYIFICVVCIASIFLHLVEPSLILFGVFVPTIIHVSIFTAVFMLFGALKSRSSWGILAVILFCLGWMGCFVFYKNPAFITTSTNTLEVLLESTFIHLGSILAQSLGFREAGSDYLLLTDLGIKIQTLFAFCYTYHYLNWFSKTRVINWHEVSRKWIVGTIIIWILALTIYTIDYRIGFMALFFLSMLHVILEFPLNHLSFLGVFQELKLRFK